MSKKIVITGGIGYIGTELCKIYSGYSWNNEIIVIANTVTIKLLKNTDSFSEKEWNQLYKLSEETFVEESDSLKGTAAGAGLTDND